MKRVFSIALAAIILMNTLGYYGVFLGLQYQNTRALTNKLDSDQYDESNTFTFEIPLVVPYMYNDVDFKRAYGTFENEGQTYHLIKQKYANDTLTIVVVRDTESKRIKDAMTDYVMTFTDNAGEEHQGSSLTVTFIKEYLPQAFTILTSSTGWQQDVGNNAFARNLIPTFTASVIHPPERA